MNFKLLIIAFWCIATFSSFAKIGFTLEIDKWESLYLAQPHIQVSDRDPDMYYRIDSPNGEYWAMKGPGISSSRGSNFTNDFGALIETLTNGTWSLTVNDGEPSETVYEFHVEFPNISTNTFGNITITNPGKHSVSTNNPPTFEWSTTCSFPEVKVSVRDLYKNDLARDTLQEDATNWTPTNTLAEGINYFYLSYVQSNHLDASISLPTSRSDGTSLGDWSTSVSLSTYTILEYAISEEPILPIYPTKLDVTITRSFYDGTDSFFVTSFVKNEYPYYPPSAEVESPNALCLGSRNSSSSAIFTSLSSALSECKAGSWKLYLNRNTPSNKVYSFTMNLDGIDDNLLKRVEIHSPTNGANSLFGNPDYAWYGPTNFSKLRGRTQKGFMEGSADLETWENTPVLAPGENYFMLTYSFTNCPFLSTSTPSNDVGDVLESWNASLELETEAVVTFLVSTNTSPPVLSLSSDSERFVLDYPSTNDPNQICVLQTCTNLAEGAWESIYSFIGSGALLRFKPSITNPAAYYRVISAP